jgi:hypothetical protein
MKAEQKNLVKVFHGTTNRALDSILEVGELSNTEEKRWNPSQDDVYFWNPLDLQELECLETLEEAENFARNRALENAICAFAHDKAATGIAVISFWVDLDEISSDDSCPNMGGAGCVSRPVSVKDFERVELSKENLSAWKFFAAATLIKNKFFILNDYSYMERSLIEQIASGNVEFHDDFFQAFQDSLEEINF